MKSSERPPMRCKRESLWAGLALGVILLYVLPYYLLGEDSHIRVHDNLDSNIAWYKVLARSGKLFAGPGAVIPQVINGLPREAYGSEWTGIVWLNALFPPMAAYAVNMTITRIFAFLGMYLLLKDHFVKERGAAFIRIGVSLAFALTPFWPSGMLSTLGHPLALWAFLNIRGKDYSLKNWLTLTLLPFYSSFVLGFFFFLVGIAFFWLYDRIKTGKRNLPFFAAIAWMTAVYLLIEYRLFYSVLFGGEPFHRVEFVSSRHDFFRTFKLFLKNFLFGHHHVLTLHTFVILPVLTAVFLLLLFRRSRDRLEKTILFLYLLNAALSFWYALWFNKIWLPLKENFGIFTAFNFARFHFLRPFVIYFSFALSLYFLWRKGRRWRAVVYGLIVAQICLLLPFHEEVLYGRYFRSPSFKAFYAQAQFREIETFIGMPKGTYRVASLGLHPAIAQYNGFYTLDTYNNLYPLAYKRKFRKIIARELAKDKGLRIYFDEWGSRCYLFAAELGKKYDYRKDSNKGIKNLELNTDAFEELGGRFLFSAVPIGNAEKNRLRLLRIFDHPDSAWKIYLYEVMGKENNAAGQTG